MRSEIVCTQDSAGWWWASLLLDGRKVIGLDELGETRAGALERLGDHLHGLSRDAQNRALHARYLEDGDE